MTELTVLSPVLSHQEERSPWQMLKRVEEARWRTGRRSHGRSSVDKLGGDTSFPLASVTLHKMNHLRSSTLRLRSYNLYLEDGSLVKGIKGENFGRVTACIITL